MFSEHNNHTEALVMMNTGKIFPGRPALGSWISYALGTENQNLPAYIVLRDPEGYNTSGTSSWQNGWLPALYRGTEVSTKGTPVLDLQRAVPVTERAGRANLEFLARLNEEHRQRFPHESELEARIRNYELAARMQLAAGRRARSFAARPRPPSGSTAWTTRRPKVTACGCLMARRLVEAGVRFVQVFPPVKPSFQPWDAHSNVKTENEAIAAKTDLPSAALIKDLKNRGLLDTTIVLWTGEFGRLPGLAKRHRPRPQPQRLQPAAGRRRLQGRATSTGPPTTSATVRWKTASASPTCTPRSCTSWASTTTG